LNKPKSLQSTIILFFVGSTVLTFLLLGTYSVYDYHKELDNSLQQALHVVAEDLMHHDASSKKVDVLDVSEHFLQEYKKAPFITLFNDLNVVIAQSNMTDENRCSVVKQLPNSDYLIVSSSRKTIDEKLITFIVKMLSVFGTALLLLILVFNYLLHRLFLPLRCLVDFCKDSSTAHQTLPSCGGSSEVYDLKEAIVGLVDANDSLCQQKQDIFKEAAHEIKSPIAILKARLALFKQDENIKKELFIKDSEADIKTISNKLRELLFLKEIEWDMQKQRETISMQDQCLMMQQAFRPILEKKGLSMISNWEEDFRVSIHKEAIQKVMQAIFENIFMHTKNNSTITNHVDSKVRRLHIVNEVGSKSDETLFSSYIGSKMIARLADKLDYSYEVEEREGKYYTTIVFNTSQRKCEV